MTGTLTAHDPARAAAELAAALAELARRPPPALSPSPAPPPRRRPDARLAADDELVEALAARLSELGAAPG